MKEANMTTTVQSLTSRPAWKALEAHYQQVRDLHLRKLFADDPKRGERMVSNEVGLSLDYSKNRITDESLKLLLQLAEECNLRARIDAMFRGEKINVTENRAVLHVALRAPKAQPSSWMAKMWCPGPCVLDKMTAFPIGFEKATGRGTRANHSQHHQHRHRRSDLGPVMAYEALKFYSDRSLTFRFVSNIDGTISSKRPMILIRQKPCSSSRRRPYDLETIDQRSECPRLVAQRSRRDKSAVAKHFVAVRPTLPKCRNSASTRPTCSVFGTGWADATRWIRPSAFRRCWPSGPKTSAQCSRLSSNGRTLPHRAVCQQLCRC